MSVCSRRAHCYDVLIKHSPWCVRVDSLLWLLFLQSTCGMGHANRCLLETARLNAVEWHHCVRADSDRELSNFDLHLRQWNCANLRPLVKVTNFFILPNRSRLILMRAVRPTKEASSIKDVARPVIRTVQAFLNGHCSCCCMELQLCIWTMQFR